MEGIVEAIKSFFFNISDEFEFEKIRHCSVQDFAEEENILTHFCGFSQRFDII